ncbi:CYFA0S06e01794g1_1 [Cyberlindnera fabianii]|uniref:CYFA0S06e01794g1_1 n=1 Tax=Cyberlindnera fabianii TaxID=36022 RepID=A0A061ATZ8_CYBFA|nr:CYFA0S06e01794g1_1 [Cyberlindnera fabianii]
MRAYHMPSLPEIPLEQFHGSDSMTETRSMKLKVLYAVDNQTNFLARSNHTLKVKTIRIPIPNQNDIMTLGVVPLKEVIFPVMQSSPELFSDQNSDYSVYVKDVSEEDEPFVGQGLASVILSKNALDDEVLVPGRVCSSFASFLNKGPSEILEIRLRLSKVIKSSAIPQPQTQQQPQVQTQVQQSQQPSQPYLHPAPQQSNHGPSSTPQPQPVNKRTHDQSFDTEDEEEDNSQSKFVQPKPLQKKSTATRYVNTAPAPKAARTQSLPTFDIVPTLARLPPQSIARRIYMADKNNIRGTNFYNGDQNSNSTSNSNKNYNSSPVDAISDVSKRFAPDFITKTPDYIKKKNTSAAGNGRKGSLSQEKQPQPQPQPIAPAPSKDDNSRPPICFHCKTNTSKSWRWSNSEEESKRGMMCYDCYQYMTTKGVMRPKKLITGQAKRRREKAQAASSPISSGNDTAPTTTPGAILEKNGLSTTQYYSNSSDAMNDLEDMIHSDLDFNLGPMTDIDPFPQADQSNQFSDDKENVPPSSRQNQSRLVSVRRASKQNSFEKMLIKSFSGAPPMAPGAGMSPNDWMTDLFNAEPTPKDGENNNVTPRDTDNTPHDMTTCNTLPCNEESPEEPKTVGTAQLNKLKASAAMPSSPLIDESRLNTSPSSMNDWAQGDSTALSSQVGNDLPPKAHFTHDPSIGANYTQQGLDGNM